MVGEPAQETEVAANYYWDWDRNHSGQSSLDGRALDLVLVGALGTVIIRNTKIN